MAFKWWEVVIIFTGLLFAIAYCWIAATPTIQQRVRLHGENMLWAPLEQVLAEADNGDILLFAGRRTNIIRFVSASPFSHVALVFRDYDHPNQKGPIVPYVWDADLGQGKRAGARITRLADKLARLKGGPTIVGWKRLRSARPTTAHVLRTVANYLGHGMDRLMLKWFFNRFLNSPGVPTPGKMFCSELVAQTSADLGLFNAATPAARYAPGDWLTNNLDLAPGVQYGPTTYTKVNHDT